MGSFPAPDMNASLKAMYSKEPMFRDKFNKTIGGEKWLELQNQPGYRTVAIKAINEHIVHTEWVGLDIHTPGYYFRTTVYIKQPKNKRAIGVVWTPTIQKACKLHSETVNAVMTGKEDGLKKVMTELKPEKLEDHLCPLCKGSMSLRHGKFGAFYGCDEWPSTGCAGKRSGKTGQPTSGTYKLMKTETKTKKTLEKVTKNGGDLATRAGSITID